MQSNITYAFIIAQHFNAFVKENLTFLKITKGISVLLTFCKIIQLTNMNAMSFTERFLALLSLT